MDNILLQSSSTLLRSFVLVTGAYLGLLVILRVSGKRTLSKMNAFDLVVTVSLGSTLATIGLSKDVALLQGLVVLALLVGLQYVVAWLSVRSTKIESWVKAEPALLFHNGKFLQNMLVQERVTRDEIFAAVRAQGYADLSNVQAVVLETDGSFSVISSTPQTAHATLQNVKGFNDRKA